MEVVIGLIILLLLVVVVMMIHDTFFAKAEACDIESTRLPLAFDGYKIVQLADLHQANYGHHQQKLISLVAQQQPDIIVITGDLFETHNDHKAYWLLEGLIKLAPVYYVTGNHETKKVDLANNFDWLQKHGIIILDGHTISLTKDQESISLSGLADPLFEIARHDKLAYQKWLKKHVQKVSPNGPYHILLTHRPEGFDAYQKAGYDLVIAGHAHGGQIRLPIIGALYAPEQGFRPAYAGGQYRKNETVMLVSYGLGTSVIPLRWCCQGRITVITLHHQKGDSC